MSDEAARLILPDEETQPVAQVRADGVLMFFEEATALIVDATGSLQTIPSIVPASSRQVANDMAHSSDEMTDIVVDAAGRLTEQRENKLHDCIETGHEISGLRVMPPVQKSGKRQRGARFRAYWLRRNRRVRPIWRAVPSKGRKRVPS